MLQISCTPPPPDIASLTPEERQLFGKLVHDLRKQGKDLESAQLLAYSLVLLQSVPYVRV
jgi:DNA replication initiation complex subunit (GINS family)